MKRNEGQEDAEACGSRSSGQQGWLSDGQDRVPEKGTRSDGRRVRLKRSVEVFQSARGSLHLLRLGLGDDLEIEDPGQADHLILDLLARGFTSATEIQRTSETPPNYVLASIEALDAAGVLEYEYHRSLGPVEAERFDRQLIYFADLEGGDPSSHDMQRRLIDAHVVLIGCGGLGSWVACGLVSAGLGKLTLIDDDTVELSNLNRQLLFTEEDLGGKKVEVAAAALLANNSRLKVNTVHERICSITDLERLLPSDCDLVIATADWPPHDLPRWVNRACVRAGIPWLGAGQFPPKLRVGPLVVPGLSACLECHEEQIRASYPLYDEIAEWRASRTTPDASVGPVAGVIGTVLASEAMHLLLGTFEPASLGAALLIDLRTMSIDRERVESVATCGLCAEARLRLEGRRAA